MKLYVARDESDSLYLYKTKPLKYKHSWNVDTPNLLGIDKKYFPEVKWEDSEPTEVELVIKK